LPEVLWLRWQAQAGRCRSWLRGPGAADNALLSLENASDGELRASGDLHRGIRQAALDEQAG
jgi:hypothetical protein